MLITDSARRADPKCRPNRCPVHLRGATADNLAGLLMKCSWFLSSYDGRGTFAQCESGKLQYVLFCFISDDLGSTKAMVFSPKAWAISFPT